MPEVREVSFYRYDFNFDDSDVFQIIVRDNDGKQHEYRISDLYERRSNADRALLVAQEQRLAKLGEVVAETRARTEQKGN